MPALVLDLLKYLFLALLYIFLARAVRALYYELKTAAAAASPAPSRSQRRGKVPGKVTVVEGGPLKGKSFDLRGELTIGRADKCHIVLDDTYVSQVHARIFERDGAVVAEDLGSTNGTYLNRRRITAPTEVHRGDRLKIGKTVLEMKK